MAPRLNASVGSPFRLDGTHALVTGASGGIGAAIAEALAAAGARRLTLVGRDRRALGLVARRAAARGSRADMLVCDVTDPDALQDAFGRVGPLDALICAAGANVPQALDEIELDTADRLWTLNVRAGLHATREAVARMPASGGVVVFISSQMGHVGAARRSVYCATKHAIEGLTRALAVELAPRGVRVIAVAPTFVLTQMTEPFLADPAFRADVLRRIPLGRLAEPAEVAAAVVYAASPAAASVTGCSLRVDGGWTAQ